ncbi:alpha-galactosidase [Halobacillus litoralis]|uniref:alpha-galactosidase n=1 Tax=Halobacillus litoralis TaxID=45668 RepID=UPI001CD50BE3|nr:alpha-galactosidase [Halobacillus litoralis]MCA0971523.1 alpha-galactosidase [Halobacillus litoralis]
MISVEQNQFHLSNNDISYIFHVMPNGQLGHLYYGKGLKSGRDYSHFQTYSNVAPNTTHPYEARPDFSLETVKQEFPSYGKGDFRESSVLIENEAGEIRSDFNYESHIVVNGKPSLEGLPASYTQEEDAETLIVTLKEPSGLKLELLYTIFTNLPVITRSCLVKNEGGERVTIQRLMSLNLDLPDSDYDMLHLTGAWARERHVTEKSLSEGIQRISSLRGASSHQHNPFMALKRFDATEHNGEVLGMHFVYSGNFVAQAEVDHYSTTRVSMGIHPTRFSWSLQPGDGFQSPEAVLTFSSHGLNGLSQSVHQWTHRHMIPERFRTAERPVLINNWEATYFDFDEKKLDDFATKAKDLGVELFVLDDGWFGKRDDDTTSLGDWFVDQRKLPNGIGQLAANIKSKGLQFGLWFEPEMISPVSDLIKTHPDWVVGMNNRHQTLGRNQKVLDFSNSDVVDYLYERMSSIIEETRLDYIKWDMNRNITEPFSINLSNQGEFYHRYMLGVYQLYDRLTKAYPHVLFESCAGGGGRFDLGMMYYAPQAWTSDDTDAVERLKIQYGTSIAYPLSTIGSHVSAVPNHQTKRESPLSLRGDVAYFGTFGYELDPSSLTDEEKEEIKQQIHRYKQIEPLIRKGTFTRLISPFDQDETAWMLFDQEEGRGVVGWYKPIYSPNPKNNQVLKLKGLDRSVDYEVNGKQFGGDELMSNGLPLGVEFNGANHSTSERGGDNQSKIWFISEVDRGGVCDD